MKTYSFAGYLLADDLSRNGNPVRLEPKPLSLLRCLCEHSRRRLSTTELLRRVWPGAVVEPAVVHTAMRAIRLAMPDVRISNKISVGFQLHVEVTAAGTPCTRESWRYYVAHTTGTTARRIAAADELAQAESERFGA